MKWKSSGQVVTTQRAVQYTLIKTDINGNDQILERYFSSLAEHLNEAVTAGTPVPVCQHASILTVIMLTLLMLVL